MDRRVFRYYDDKRLVIGTLYAWVILCRFVDSGDPPLIVVHPFNVIVAHSTECNELKETATHQLESLPPDISASVHAALQYLSVGVVGTQTRRRQNLRALNFLMNSKRFKFSDVTPSVNNSNWQSLSKRYLPHLDMDIIYDPNTEIDSGTISKLASYLPCWRFPPTPDTSFSMTTFGNDPEKHISIKKFTNVNSYPFMPNDYDNVDDWHIRRCNLSHAWSTFNGEKKGVVVAVVDSGCSFHPDLSPNLWIDENRTTCRGADSYHPTRARGCYGWDFSIEDGYTQPSNLTFWDRGNPLAETLVHGTAVSGIIAAVTNNKFGVPGMCFGCKVVCLKISDPYNRFSTSSMISAYNYIIEKGFKISNHSYTGLLPRDHAVVDAMQRLASTNHLIVTAAGNDDCKLGDDKSPHACSKDSTKLLFPADITAETTLTVGSISYDDRISWFSNYGPAVDLMAPGSSIRTLTNTRIDGTLTKLRSGTSYAAPMVAGAAALIWASNPEFTAMDVKTRMLETLRKSRSLEGLCSSGGVLDFYNSTLANHPSTYYPFVDYQTPVEDLTDFFYEMHSPNSTTVNTSTSTVTSFTTSTTSFTASTTSFTTSTTSFTTSTTSFTTSTTSFTFSTTTTDASSSSIARCNVFLSFFVCLFVLLCNSWF